MKIKFKNIKDKVDKKEQAGLAQYHQKFGGVASLRLLSLKSKFREVVK